MALVASQNQLSKVLGRTMMPSQVEIERELETVAQLMDNRFRIPVIGWRFGLNAIIDLIPGIGDTATSLVAIYVLTAAVRYRVPKVTMLRMALNIVIYFVIGLIPWLGDIFGAWWKPNLRNLALLRSRATVSAAQATHGKTSDWIFVSVVIAVILAMLLGTILISFLVLQFILQNIRLY